MKKKFYTTYLANVKKLQDKNLDFYLIAKKEIPKMSRILSLAPPSHLLSDYKNGVIEWLEFEEKFKEFLTANRASQIDLDIVERLVNADHNICLVCFEKDNSKCHRRLVAEELQKRGLEWEEL